MNRVIFLLSVLFFSINSMASAYVYEISIVHEKPVHDCSAVYEIELSEFKSEEEAIDHLTGKAGNPSGNVVYLPSKAFSGKNGVGMAVIYQCTKP